MSPYSVCRLLVLHLLCCTGFTASELCADDLFSTQVAPLLQRKCLSCHNSDDRKGEFSLQTSADLTASGMVQPGAPDDSQLLHEVLPHNGQPPAMPQDGQPLSATETDLLRRWIAAGASWPDGLVLQAAVVQDFSWWSFQPLQTTTPPAFTDAAAGRWIRNPVDAFVLQTMRQQGLQPAPEADRRTLIRRLSFDLLGLPPAPEDVEAFVADQAPDAYERLVDRLLASPQYGERWARYWLDVVRYADTCGYDKDKLRPMPGPTATTSSKPSTPISPTAGLWKNRSPATCCIPATRTASLASALSRPGRGTSSGTSKFPKQNLTARSLATLTATIWFPAPSTPSAASPSNVLAATITNSIRLPRTIIMGCRPSSPLLIGQIDCGMLTLNPNDSGECSQKQNNRQSRHATTSRQPFAAKVARPSKNSKPKSPD
ncbi:MAG UNVERIFIED_CONTAM: DUF1549 domain-containing protein [Planctomycetaceae bacterium]